MKKILAVLLFAACLLMSCAALAQEEATVIPGPYLITSAGQSADAEMLKVMMTKLKIEDYTVSNLATEADIANYGAILVAVGGSSKGLGAAGIDADQELERVTKLLAAAKEAGVKIIALHIGGSARRGDLSDKFIEPCLSVCDAAIVVAEGNGDGLFDELAKNYGFPLTQVEKIAAVVTPLGELLGK